MCIMVSKQKMGCWLMFWESDTIKALAAIFTGFSASVHAKSCSQACKRRLRMLEFET